jgi:hypothetical protein
VARWLCCTSLRTVGDDGYMRNRVLAWGGAAVTALALTGLAVYLARVGLDKADKLASVISAFVAVAGLVVSGYGLARERGHTSSPSAPAQPGAGPQTTKKQVNVGRDGATLFAVMDGTMNIEGEVSRSPRQAGTDTTSGGSDAGPGGA